MNFELVPEAASTQADAFDRLFLTMSGFAMAIVILVGTLVVVFAWRFRANSSTVRGAVKDLQNRQIEVGWTVATAFFALFFFWYASSASIEAVEAPPDAMEIHVEAKQWMWKAKHPGGAMELNALHVPTGRPITVLLNSQDVIHSFYIPAFRIKRDVVPGRTSTIWFEPTKPGVYHLFCAEYCGTDHAGMGGEVIVMEPDDYARWIDSRPQGDTLVAHGRELFTAAGCSGCHAPASKVHAPQLDGLFGRLRPLDDGRVVEADAGYLRNSIMLPKTMIAAGYEPIMPNFSSLLDDGEVEALVAYIRSLAPDNEDT